MVQGACISGEKIGPKLSISKAESAEKTTRTLLIVAMLFVTSLYLFQDNVSKSLNLRLILCFYIDTQQVFCATWSNEGTTFLNIASEYLDDVLQPPRFGDLCLIPACHELFFAGDGGTVQIAGVIFVQVV